MIVVPFSYLDCRKASLELCLLHGSTDAFLLSYISVLPLHHGVKPPLQSRQFLC